MLQMERLDQLCAEVEAPPKEAAEELTGKDRSSAAARRVFEVRAD